ncbi:MULTISPECIES: Ltp family lipoprotein [Corynebacterium]|uniref:Ltp family lipoprotein n=1 Tax=Corynebacterium TaxID=1716 RepID=UPI0009F66D79|nr:MULTISPECIES: Ltp family lipoprotein [Corynebacterium]MDK8727308.1 Ltp family lipoprotein [Corynebacterium amycolatum]
MSDSTFPQNPQSPQNPYGSQNPYISQDPQASLGRQYYQHNPQDPLGQQSYPQGPSAAGQVPPAPKEKKKGGCFKWGGIAAGAVVVLAVAASLTGGGDTDAGSDSEAASLFGSETAVAADSGTVENADFAEAPEAGADEQQGQTGEQQKQDEKVPTEYKNALRKAEIYANRMHMSKAGIYDQLTSEYGEKFSPEAAQYAMDNLDADWNKNALEKARIYQDSMAMSPDAVYEQLTSEYGEQFTPEEAQYAVDNL